MHNVLVIALLAGFARFTIVQENFCKTLYITRHDSDTFMLKLFSLSMQIQDEGRTKVRKALTRSRVQLALQRILPFPCRKQYTVVILMPRLSHFRMLKSLLHLSTNGFSRDAKVCHSMFLQDIIICCKMSLLSYICCFFRWYSHA